MRKGFTLIELVITLSVIAALLYSAMPSWAQFVERFRVKSTASQLNSVFVAAKREAINRNKDIWLHITIHPLAGEYRWNIMLSTNQQGIKNTEGEPGSVIAVYQGEATFVTSNRSLVKVLGKNGKFSAAGHIEFSQNSSNQPAFKLIYHHITARVRICSVNGSYYGYSSC